MFNTVRFVPGTGRGVKARGKPAFVLNWNLYSPVCAALCAFLIEVQKSMSAQDQVKELYLLFNHTRNTSFYMIDSLFHLRFY